MTGRPRRSVAGARASSHCRSARARRAGEDLRLEAAVYDVAGGRPLEAATRGLAANAERLGRELAARLLDAGAGALVARARRSTPFA